jgi:NAD(P)H dehydrogenase (quinone)
MAKRIWLSRIASLLGHAEGQALFESQGMLHPLPRMQMLDGFNEGWIDFEGGQASTIKGKVELQTVLQELVDRAGRERLSQIIINQP